MSWEAFIHNNFLVKLAVAALELVVGFFLGPMVKNMIMRLQNRKGVDEGVLTFTGSVASILIRLLAIIIALGQIGVDMSVVVGAFSAVGLGISLALKDNMANVASGLQILITRPFRVGDYIACKEMEGTVMSVEIMFTTLETFDNQLVVSPNRELIANAVTNYSVYPSRRLVLKVPVSLFSDVEAFRARALSIMQSNSKVLKDPAPKTVIGDYTPSGTGIEVGLVCYSTIEDFWDMKFELQEAVQTMRRELGINAPKDYVEVAASSSDMPVDMESRR